MQAILSRLGAARLVIQQADASLVPSISRAQKTAVLAQLKATSVLTAEQKAQIMDSAITVGFVRGDLQSVVEALEPAACKDVSGTRRRGQDYRLSLLDYMTASDWEQLDNKDVASTTKLELLIDLSIALGLRLPSEFTFKFLTSLFIVTSNLAKADGSGRESKMRLLKFVKAEFQRYSRKAQQPSVWLERLAPPLELRAQHPALFESFMKNRVPVTPNRNIVADILAMDESFGCRGRMGTAASLESTVAVGAPASQAIQMMERMMAQFFQCMKPQPKPDLVELNFPERPPKAMKALTMPEQSPVSSRSSTSSPLQLTLGADGQLETSPSPSYTPAPSSSSAAPPSSSSAAPPSPSSSAASDLVIDAAAAVKDVEEKAQKRLQDFMGMLVERKKNPRSAAGTDATKNVSKEAAKNTDTARKDASGPAAKNTTKNVSKVVKNGPTANAAKKKGGSATIDYTPDPVPKKASRFSQPGFSVERSRSQIQLRSGFRGSGQARTVKFGAEHMFSDEGAATAAASAWLECEQQRQKRLKLL